MYTQEESEKALKLYEEVGSITKVIKNWIVLQEKVFINGWETQKKSDKIKVSRGRINNSPEQPLHPSPELKLETNSSLLCRGRKCKISIGRNRM